MLWKSIIKNCWITCEKENSRRWKKIKKNNPESLYIQVTLSPLLFKESRTGGADAVLGVQFLRMRGEEMQKAGPHVKWRSGSSAKS